MFTSVTGRTEKFQTRVARATNALRAVDLRKTFGVLMVAAVLALTAAPAGLGIGDTINTPMGDCASDMC